MYLDVVAGVFLISLIPLILTQNDDKMKDAVIELFNDCTCVPYYLCDNDNFIITDGSGLIDLRQNDTNRIPCTNLTQSCCKNKTETITTTTALPKRKNSTYTQFFKDENSSKLLCGQQKVIIDTRIKTKDEIFASTLRGEFPWIVSIFSKMSSDEYKYKAAGSIIHPQVILTATHSVRSSKAEDLRIQISGDDLTELLDTPENSQRYVKKKIQHPDYYSGSLANDIALLILNEPFTFENLTINSICLPEADDNFDKKRCISAGWGTGNSENEQRLRKVELPIVDDNTCQELLRKTRLGNFFILDKSFVCAGGEEGQDTCYGDGGAPLMCLGDHGRYVQVGIVAWGIGCGTENVPGVYANVPRLRKWIDEELKKENII